MILMAVGRKKKRVEGRVFDMPVLNRKSHDRVCKHKRTKHASEFASKNRSTDGTNRVVGGGNVCTNVSSSFSSTVANTVAENGGVVIRRETFVVRKTVMSRSTIITALFAAIVVRCAADMSRTQNHVVGHRYNAGVAMIEDIMLNDVHWFPIMKHPVNVPYMPARHTDHFAADVPPAGDDAVTTVTVNAFGRAVDLMSQKTMVHTEVSLVVAAVKGALLCSALRHVSLQAFLLEHIIVREEERRVSVAIAGWVEFMAQLAIDKLTALDVSAPVVNRLQFRLHRLLRMPADQTLAVDALAAINAELYGEAAGVCHVPDGQGLYRPLIADLDKSVTLEKMRDLAERNVGENTDKLTDVHQMADIDRYYGTLQIPADIRPEGFADLSLEELKKVFVVNRVAMNHTYLNLRVKALAPSQWANIFDLDRVHANAS